MRPNKVFGLTDLVSPQSLERAIERACTEPWPEDPELRRLFERSLAVAEAAVEPYQKAVMLYVDNSSVLETVTQKAITAGLICAFLQYMQHALSAEREVDA